MVVSSASSGLRPAQGQYPYRAASISTDSWLEDHLNTDSNSYDTYIPPINQRASASAQRHGKPGFYHSFAESTLKSSYINAYWENLKNEKTKLKIKKNY